MTYYYYSTGITISIIIIQNLQFWYEDSVNHLDNGVISLDVSQSWNNLGTAWVLERLSSWADSTVVDANGSLWTLVDIQDLGVVEVCSPALELLQALGGQLVIWNDVVSQY